jgi:hypothetical protein
MRKNVFLKNKLLKLLEFLDDDLPLPSHSSSSVLRPDPIDLGTCSLRDSRLAIKDIKPLIKAELVLSVSEFSERANGTCPGYIENGMIGEHHWQHTGSIVAAGNRGRGKSLCLCSLFFLC